MLANKSRDRFNVGTRHLLHLRRQLLMSEIPLVALSGACCQREDGENYECAKHLTRFDPIFGYFKRNTQILGLIRLALGIFQDKIVLMAESVLRMPRAGKPKLLDQVRNVIRRKHYSIRTEQAYIDWIKRFIIYHGKRHPGEMAEEEVAEFLTHLARDLNVAASTQNQALSALLFLYKEVLNHEIGWLEKVERAKKPPKLPVVLSRTEVKRVFAYLHGTPKLMAGLLYGSGLRLMECVRLRIKDVDFELAQITVRDAKGGKDRVTMLPMNLAEPLRRHLSRVKAQHEQDLEDGFGSVHLPFALGRKSPNAAREWAWQYVFPSS